MHRRLLLSLLFATQLGLVGAGCGGRAEDGVATGLADGQRPPDFVLGRLGGGEMALSDLRGKVVILSFWATWCGPCRQELPALQQLRDEYGERGFEVLAVSIDSNQVPAERMVEQLGLRFPAVFDRDGRRVADRYRVSGIPQSYVLDRAGRIRFRHTGFNRGSVATLRAEVESLLSEDPNG